MPDAPRLVPSPVFLLSPIRSGSTLLRCLLDSHPAVHAPHELHLSGITAGPNDEFATLALKTLGLSSHDLEHLLWDALLHHQLTLSGKQTIVDKTPGNVFIWRRLISYWPDARFIVLRRHPAAIATSIVTAGDAADLETAATTVDKFATSLEEAAEALPALAVTYEQLTADPETVCRRVCDHLGLGFDPGMLDYGRHDHGPFVYGIGDWSPQIRSGTVQTATPPPPPDTWPDLIRAWAERWGYPR